MAGDEVRVLGLACSPRRGGNTDLMLDSALEGARASGATTEKLYVAGLDLHPCRACNACFKTGRCVQKDDMQDLYPKLLSREGVVLAAPIFSMNLAAQAKILIDRLQCLWAMKFILKRHTVADGIGEVRRGLWLSAAGSKREDIFEPALPTVGYFFDMLEIKDWERLTYGGVDEKGTIRDVHGALDACRDAGARLAGKRGQ